MTNLLYAINAATILGTILIFREIWKYAITTKDQREILKLSRERQVNISDKLVELQQELTQILDEIPQAQTFAALQHSLAERLSHAVDTSALHTSSCDETRALVRGQIADSVGVCDRLISEQFDVYRSLLQDETAELDRYLALKKEVRRSGLRRLMALLGWQGHDIPILFAAQRGEDLVLLAAPPDPRLLDYLEGLPAYDVERLVRERKLKRVVLFRYASEDAGSQAVTFNVPARLPKAIVRGLKRCMSSSHEMNGEPRPLSTKEYFEILAWARQIPGAIDFLALYITGRLETDAADHYPPPSIAPFDKTDQLPSASPASPKKRSALFVNNSYYHFKYLSAALRDRGWETLSIDLDPPDVAWRSFLHGQDLNLYHPDPEIRRKMVRDFLRDVPERFGSLHFYGQNTASIFRETWENSSEPQLIPWDFLELRRHNILIGYMPTGCMDGGSQSSIRQLTGGLCRHCAWELQPHVCHDSKNLIWGRKLDAICDVVTIEGDFAVDSRTGPMYVKRPIVTALDPQFWNPKLSIPEEHRLAREPGELMIYHAFGNAHLRRTNGRDIKGSGAVLAAVEQLKSEGMPVRVFFATDLASENVRYYQLQADVVVDQLNYGRLGANAREALMLGRPLITCIRPQQAPPLPPLQLLKELPALHATEETIYEVLKGLLLDAERRKALGEAGRDFALHWHAASNCALRYERMIDRLRAGLPPEADEVFA